MSSWSPLRLARSGRARWRRSLTFRVVTTTLALSLVVVMVLGQLLVSRIADGLLDAKTRTSLVEARAGLTQAQSAVSASDRTDAAGTTRLVDQVAVQLAKRGGGTPRLYDVMLLGSSAAIPQRGSNLVAESSIPGQLRDAMQVDERQAWTFTQIQYTDGRAPVPGLVVGAPLAVPGIGTYELYYVFPLVEEGQTLALVRRTLTVAGLVLVGLLAWISWFVTRQVVDPVRNAASIAEQFSAGRLTERMKVSGDDDLARLASSFNHMAESLERQIGQLEELSRVQRRFVSDVSHELRTPLTTVRMAADVLHEERDQFDSATARSAELLQNQLDRFEALLTELLEISRFDAGAAVLDPTATDLRDVAQRVVEAAAPLAERRGTAVRLDLSPEACIADVDVRRIERVLRNLLDNAVEHSEGRPVEVAVRCGGGAVAVGVRDHGVGLRPGESSLVFNRFWRADPARARTTGGTGLGLAIALEDARLHGGWLQAWGQPGDGSHFRLTVPCRLGADLTSSPLPLEPADADTARRLPVVVAGVGGHRPARGGDADA